ncbi:MAG TPA: diacylglycerol kinase family protein [Streptosporangiaceae bacterium]
MPTAAFVINRTLVRDPRRLIRQCTEASKASGWDPAFVPTGRAAIASGADLVFAAGGDGTVQGCARALASTGVPLAIIPLGTANLTARALGIPGRTSRAIETGFGGRDHRIDLARTSGADVTDETIFTAMAGIGLDATVVRATRPRNKRRLGWFSYAVTGVARLSAPRARFTIRLDDGEPLSRTARSVVVGNVGLLPGGFTLLPSASLDDGLLDVGILAPASPVDWAIVAAQVMSRDDRKHRRLERYQARHVEISSEAELPRQADGELLAPGRSLSVSVWPGALIVRRPV